MTSAADIAHLWGHLTAEERAELDTLVAADLQAVPWRPQAGPQRAAYDSPADVVGFGGAAGGGKTDLAIGKALTQHWRTQIFRREGPQLVGIVDRLRELVPPDDVGGNPPVYKGADGRKIELNSMPNLGDEKKYQGRPKDFLVIDEATNFLEAQVRFVKGWVRTTRPGQRTQTLMTFNPPTDADGRWIVTFFAPWLDDTHPLYPTAPGALRWCYVDPAAGRDVWLPDDDPRPFVLVDGRREYEFDPRDWRPEDVVRPESRTFIPSRVTDNAYLAGGDYLRTLQAMPEPLRSQMLYGDFRAGMGEDPWQVIPTAWIDAAFGRWRPRLAAEKGEMLAVGVDVARGGDDQTVIARRHPGLWFDELLTYPGKQTPDGHTTATLVLLATRDRAPIHIDVIGVGASPYDILSGTPGRGRHDVLGVNVANKATKSDASGRLRFANLRAQLWWMMREALDPANDTGIALPAPDEESRNRLRRELSAPRWSQKPGGNVQVESRDDIIKRLGYSPDLASALILALIETPKASSLQRSGKSGFRTMQGAEYDPYANLL